VNLLAQAVLSGWGIAAGVSFLVAAAFFGLKGKAGAAVAASGFGLAAALMIIAIITAGGAPPSTQSALVQQTPGAPGEDPGPGLALIDAARQMLNRGENAAATQALNQALDLFGEDNNLAGKGRALLELGRVDHYAGQAAAARDHYARALAVYQEAESLEGQARAFVAMGDLEKDTFQWDAATEFFRQARGLWALVPDPKSDPHVLLKLESVASTPQGLDAALAVLDQASLIFENLGDDDGLGDVSMLRGDLCGVLGDVLGAAANYARAAFLYQEAENQQREATARVRGAGFHVMLGHNAEAQELLDRADSNFSAVSDEVGLTLVLASRGDLARLVGDLPSAASFYAAAASGFEAIGHTGEAASLLKLGQVEAFVGNVDAARAALEAAGILYGDEPGGLSAAHLALGRLAATVGDPNSGLEYARSAADIAGQAGDALGEGRALVLFADLAVIAGDVGAARKAYDDAEVLFAAANVPMGAVLVVMGRGDLAGDTGETASVYRQAAETLALIEEPVAEANRFIGLPPVSRIDLVSKLGANQDVGGDEPDPAAIAQFAAAREENLAAHPDHNVEGRSFLTEIDARTFRVLSTGN